MTAKRTRKLFRKKEWIVVGHRVGTKGFLIYDNRKQAREYAAIWRFQNPGARAVHVRISEIPKPSRKKVRRGK